MLYMPLPVSSCPGCNAFTCSPPTIQSAASSCSACPSLAAPPPFFSSLPPAPWFGWNRSHLILSGRVSPITPWLPCKSGAPGTGSLTIFPAGAPKGKAGLQTPEFPWLPGQNSLSEFTLLFCMEEVGPQRAQETPGSLSIPVMGPSLWPPSPVLALVLLGGGDFLFSSISSYLGCGIFTFE